MNLKFLSRNYRKKLENGTSCRHLKIKTKSLLWRNIVFSSKYKFSWRRPHLLWLDCPGLVWIYRGHNGSPLSPLQNEAGSGQASLTISSFVRPFFSFSNALRAIWRPERLPARLLLRLHFFFFFFAVCSTPLRSTATVLSSSPLGTLRSETRRL